MNNVNEPYRVVDRDNNGWYLAADGHGGTVYCLSYSTRMPDYATLEAACGPLRPVLPVTDADVAELDRLLSEAGRKAVTSLAAALATVVTRLYENAGGVESSAGSGAYAHRTLKAGRAGSWEAELLVSVVSFGYELNDNRKAPKSGGRHAPRADGPGRRVDRAARDGMAAVIMRWVTDPARYTEVAETLAWIVSRHADRHGADGWRKIADQWLQPSAFGGEDFRNCYGLFYSRSEHHNAGWI